MAPTSPLIPIYTMLGVEGYGSDSDSDNDTSTATIQTPLTAKPAAAQKKTGLSLPPPASGSKTSSSLSLPVPKKKAPKKIAIGLPELSNDNERRDDSDDMPPAKKPRIEMGAGSSSLFSMLPAPKNKDPIPERVLGGGKGPGLVFNTGVKRPPKQATVEDVEEEHEENAHTNLAPLSGSILEDATPIPQAASSKSAAVPFLPPSLARGKANVSTEDRPTLPKARPTPAAPAVDFFSLGAHTWNELHLILYSYISKVHHQHFPQSRKRPPPPLYPYHPSLLHLK